MPARFQHDDLVRALGPRYRVLDRELRETDDYLLAQAPTLNLKLRHRSNTLKLKSLRNVSPDRLEWWHTDYEHPLPAAAQVWDAALRMLDCDLASNRVSPSPTAEAAVDALRQCLRPAQIIRVGKIRWLYADGGSRLEVARFAYRAAHFSTVCVESDDEDRVREVLNTLLLAELGPPRNYMEVLHDASATGGTGAVHRVP